MPNGVGDRDVGPSNDAESEFRSRLKDIVAVSARIGVSI